MPRRYLGSFVTYNPVEPTTSAASGMWPLNQQLQEVAAGTWPLPFGDPYFNYTTLLLSSTALGNANNNLFVDSSGAFNPISRNGNTTQGSFAPYGTYWSNYFDGSGDYLTSSSANFAFGTGAWTVEFWIYPLAYGGSVCGAQLFGTTNGGTSGYSINLGQDVNSFRIISNATGSWADNLSVGTGNGPALNTWTHMAVVRSGANLSIYKNGTRVATTASATSWNFSGTTGVIGRFNDGSNVRDLSGYLSNLRVANTAIYDPTQSSITVPTAPPTAVSGTILLTCQSNRFRDASSNNLTVTPTGDTRVTDFSPFLHTAPIQYNQSDITNWSGYFDGSGDYLEAASNSAFNILNGGDFTVEAWVYFNSIADNSGYGAAIMGRTAGSGDGWIFRCKPTAIEFVYPGLSANSTSFTFAAGQWYHIVAQRNGSTLYYYVNGTRYTPTYSDRTTDASAQAMFIGRSGNDSGGTYAYVNGYISNARIVKGTAVYSGATITVPTTNLTAISGTSLLTLQNAAFTDNSANNFVITPNGNTTVTGNSPFNTVGYWSNYFDGNGDNLTLPSSSSYAIASSSTPFTIEAWIYPTAGGGCVFSEIFTGSGTIPIVISMSDGTAVDNLGGLYIAFGWFTGSAWVTAAIASSAVTANTWTHIACVFTGSTTKIYYNGVDVTKTSSPTPASSWGITGVAGDGWYIGRRWDGAGSNWFSGYISNIRFVNGTAVYTSAFTPPTAPLTAITNTVLLTCQSSRFVDTSAGNAAITVVGNTSVQSLNPFYSSTIGSSGGSMYFDGSGDFLNTATSFPPIGTGDFTAECWWYPVGTASQEFTYFSVGNVTTTSGFALATDPARGLFLYSGGYVNSSGVAMPVANAWNHIVFTRQAGSLRLYLNGSLRETVSWTNSISAAQVYIGRAANGYFGTPLGYMSNIRYSGTSLYSGSTYTVPTAPLTPSANTGLLVNGMNAGIYDATAINDMETVGNAQVRFPTPFAPANYWAGSFDGSGDFLSVASNAAFDLGSSDFTVECWFNANSFAAGFGLISRYNYTSVGLGWLITIQNSTTVRFVRGNDIILDCTVSAMSTGTWYHVAAVRNGSTLTVYLNGTQVGQATGISNFSDAATALQIGRTNTITNDINGSISNARVVKGTAVYTSNFTPSTTPLTAIANTSLLTCQNKTFIDNSSNAFTITAFGNATAGAIGPFTATGGTSVYFDGTGDYLTPRSTPDLDFGSGDFTVEFWAYPTAKTNVVDAAFGYGSFTLMCYHNGTNWTTEGSNNGSSLQFQISTPVTLNTWQLITITRSGTTIRLFKDGVIGATGSLTGAINTAGKTLRVGDNGNSQFFTGYIDDFRITNGYARYTTNFTPPTAAFPTY